MTMQPELSVVLISRNEETYIARSLDSVVDAAAHFPQVEIILVDSASTDRTVDIAVQYPITVIRLPPTNFLSASAGRYIGTHYATGKIVLFLDGDMTLMPGWLDQAVSALQANPQHGGVTGQLLDICLSDGQEVTMINPDFSYGEHPVYVRHFGGAALYRRDALVKAGGFNPYLISEEEPELCLRLREAGFLLLCLPAFIAHHYRPVQHTFASYFNSARNKQFTGFGQIARYHIGTRLLWKYLVERGSFLIVLFSMLATFLALLMTLLARDWVFLGTWLVIVVAFLTIYLIKLRSLSKLLLRLVLHILTALSAVWGFCMPRRSPTEYPTDVEFVRMSERNSS